MQATAGGSEVGDWDARDSEAMAKKRKQLHFRSILTELGHMVSGTSLFNRDICAWSLQLESTTVCHPILRARHVRENIVQTSEWGINDKPFQLQKKHFCYGRLPLTVKKIIRGL